MYNRPNSPFDQSHILPWSTLSFFCTLVLLTLPLASCCGRSSSRQQRSTAVAEHACNPTGLTPDGRHDSADNGKPCANPSKPTSDAFTQASDTRKALSASKTLKILLPHVCLTLLLLSYIAAGAGVFMLLESGDGRQSRVDKRQLVFALYHQIINATVALCRTTSSTAELSEMAIPWPDEKQVEEELTPLLERLSAVHEDDERFTEEDQLWKPDETVSTQWTFHAAALYALTVISTTGYDHVSPSTDAGRIFTVCFGLVGIPLMFITAADIGKFLSEMVTQAYGYIRPHLCCCRRHVAPASNTDVGSNGTPANKAVTAESLVDGGAERRVELPILSYFGLILGYCAVGGLLFTTYEKGPIWSFVHGFFFSFNTITTIGLGNVRVTDFAYLLLIVAYVIVGLAVITMCVDLASSQLKVFFTKLHYFGRQVRDDASDDIREVLKSVSAREDERCREGPRGMDTD